MRSRSAAPSIPNNSAEALVLAFVLGSLLEDSLRRSLLLFDGDPTGFLTRPISATLLAVFLVVALLPPVRARFLASRRGGQDCPARSQRLS